MGRLGRDICLSTLAPFCKSFDLRFELPFFYWRLENGNTSYIKSIVS